MKTIKTNELTGAALDWSVAKCLTGGDIFQSGRIAHAVALHNVGGTVAPYFIADSGVVRRAFEPSTDWAQGGPIIERNKIDVTWDVNLNNLDGCWTALIDCQNEICGPTILIVAMRCFVASKLGDEVNVPDEL